MTKLQRAIAVAEDAYHASHEPGLNHEARAMRHRFLESCMAEVRRTPVTAADVDDVVDLVVLALNRFGPAALPIVAPIVEKAVRWQREVRQAA